MALYFISGNKNKLKEIQAIIPHVEQLEIDLPEIQSLDARKIIEAKLNEARKHHKGEFIVEDTSLYFKCLNGLPGPLIKWFMEAMTLEELYNITEKIGNSDAEAKTIIGYIDKNGKINYFEGSLSGKIVRPNVKSRFGWDPIFQPVNSEKTFAEMSLEEKNKISMRRKAVEQLKEAIKI